MDWDLCSLGESPGSCFSFSRTKLTHIPSQLVTWQEEKGHVAARKLTCMTPPPGTQGAGVKYYLPGRLEQSTTTGWL